MSEFGRLQMAGRPHLFSEPAGCDLLVGLLAAAMGRFPEDGADCCAVQADFLFRRT